MVEFKAVIADPKTGKSYQATISGQHANSLVGKSIGDEFDGVFVSLPGYKVKLTGGSDGQGFPMRADLHKSGRGKLLLTKGVGFHPKYPGERRKKTVRGKKITPEVSQVNMKITHHGPRPIEQLLGVKKKEGEEGAEKKEDKKE